MTPDQIAEAQSLALNGRRRNELIAAIFPILLASSAFADDHLPQSDPVAPFTPVASISGTVTSVKDGDGIMFGKVEIRLQGIAAPEDSGERVDPGGPEAAAC